MDKFFDATQSQKYDIPEMDDLLDQLEDEENRLEANILIPSKPKRDVGKIKEPQLELITNGETPVKTDPPISFDLVQLDSETPSISAAKQRSATIPLSCQDLLSFDSSMFLKPPPNSPVNEVVGFNNHNDNEECSSVSSEEMERYLQGVELDNSPRNQNEDSVKCEILEKDVGPDVTGESLKAVDNPASETVSSQDAVVASPENPTASSIAQVPEEPSSEDPEMLTQDVSPVIKDISTDDPGNQYNIGDIESESSAPESDFHLTESELQMGKAKPVWIPDQDSLNCLICEKKFSVIRRRHHCRCCGRVLCGDCCSERAILPYLEGSKIKAKVCVACSKTLAKINQYEDERDRHDQRQRSASDPIASTSSGAVSDGNGQPAGGKSVMFSDGVRPGAAEETSPRENRYRIQLPSRKGKSRVTPRVNELRLENELECLLPQNLTDTPGVDLTNTVPDVWPQVWRNGEVEDYLDPVEILAQLRDPDQEPVYFVIKRNLMAKVKIVNLSCCCNKEAWFFCSQGLNVVCSPELVILIEKFEEEIRPPFDVLRFFDRHYQQAIFDKHLSDMDLSLFIDGGLHMDSSEDGILGSIDHAGFVFFRPETGVQCLQNLPLPTNSPYLFGILIDRLEVPWAKVLSRRLLFRLGQECGVYPYPIVSQRFRCPVFKNINANATPLSVLIDFFNFTYTMPAIEHSRIGLKQDDLVISLPKSAHEKLVTLIESNRGGLFSWSCSFNPDAQAHLVCLENEQSSGYTSQSFTLEENPTTIGGTFLIIDITLKDSTFYYKVLEDGIYLRVRNDTFETFVDALKRCADLTLSADEKKLTVTWFDDMAPGAIKPWVESTVDGLCLDHCRQLSLGGQHLSRVNRIGKSRFSLRPCRIFILDLSAVLNRASTENLEAHIWHLASQLAGKVAPTLVPFWDLLVAAGVNMVAIRLNLGAGDDWSTGYEVGVWPQELAEQHQVWTTVLDSTLLDMLFGQEAYGVFCGGQSCRLEIQLSLICV